MKCNKLTHKMKINEETKPKKHIDIENIVVLTRWKRVGRKIEMGRGDQLCGDTQKTNFQV